MPEISIIELSVGIAILFVAIVGMIFQVLQWRATKAYSATAVDGRLVAK